jgi:biotin transport system substrate-specific component
MSTMHIAARPLADRFISGQGFASEIARIASANLLMVLCAWIALPLPGTPVPVTGQTFGVLVVAALFGARRGSLTMVLYLLEGAVGLPVFQPFGAPGAMRFFGPTAGYLLAFPVAAFATGWLIERASARSYAAGLKARTAQWIAPLLCGEALIFAGGCAWLALLFHFSFSGALEAGLLPFLPGEVVKLALLLAALRGLELARPAKA